MPRCWYTDNYIMNLVRDKFLIMEIYSIHNIIFYISTSEQLY